MGDAQLYTAVRSHHMQYQWHRRTKWWNSATHSPTKTSYHRRENHKQPLPSDFDEPLLSDFDILVAKMFAVDEEEQNATDSVLLSSFVRDSVS